MGQKPIISPILTIPQELFITIASFMDIRFQFALAITCKMLYDYHKTQCKKQTFTLLSVPHCRMIDSIFGSITKPFEHFMSQIGWVTTEITLKKVPPNDKNEYLYPVMALYLYRVPDLPNGLNCANITALLVELNPEEASQLGISFWEKFSNLKSLRLSCLALNDDIISMISKLSLLELIYLSGCKMTKDHLSKLFESCATLEIHLLRCQFSHMSLVKLPSLIKRFKIQYTKKISIDASDCIQLSYL
jgi:hypothetical protein